MSILEYPLRFGDLVARLPIIQGGMGVRISLSGLASAVANEGGIGIISVADIGAEEPDFRENPRAANIRALKKEIRRARELSPRGIIGVNIMVVLTDYAVLVETAVREGIDIIFSGAKLPLDLPSFLQENSKTKLVPIISSARAAMIIAKKWKRSYGYLPDGFVVEGPKAGGHLGFKPDQIDDPKFALGKLILKVIEALAPFKKHDKPIPVIAAGGIYTGADIHEFLELGASGVQMATRFVTTHECDANIRFKQAYIDAKKSDIVIIKSPLGMPGRAIQNEFLDKVAQGKKVPFACPYKCLKVCKEKEAPYCISLALINACKGRLKGGFAFCGTNAYRAEEIISVHELISRISNEFETVSD